MRDFSVGQTTKNAVIVKTGERGAEQRGLIWPTKWGGYFMLIESTIASGFKGFRGSGLALLLAGAVAISLLVVDSPALAQTAENAAPKGPRVEDIIVTGRKREERLLDAPIAPSDVFDQINL